MALVTIPAGLCADNQIRVEIDYDDVTMILAVIRVINGTATAIYVSVTELASGRFYDRRFDPNSTTERVIPQGPAQRITWTINAAGKFDGLSFVIMWPVP